MNSALASLILQNSLDGVLSFDLQFQYTLWNPAMEKMTGIDAPRVLGKCAFEVFPFLEETGEDRYYQGAVEGRTCVGLTRSFVVPGIGKRCCFEAFYAPLRLEDGKIVGGLAIIRDLTARMPREEGEDLFRQLADSIPHIVWIADSQNNVTFYNRRWYDYVGTTPDRFGANLWADYVHPGDIGRLLDETARSRSQDGDAEAEFRLKRHDGTYRWHLCRTFTVRDSYGNVIRKFGTSTDIDDQKQVQSRLQNLVDRADQSEKELQKAIHTRDTFLSIASHELKTPVTSMKMQIQMMKKSMERQEPSCFSPEKVAKLITQSDKSLDRLTRLISDMLDVSKIQMGRFNLRREILDLGQLVREAVDRLSEQFEIAKIEVQTEISAKVIGYWDPHYTEQVITNLLTNVIRYAPERPLKVQVQRETKGSGAVLMVNDQGPGIAEIDQSRVFQRFERSVSADNISGMGLGLYIANEIVISHGGSIELKSDPGHGATFIVRLPLGPKESENETKTHSCH